MSKLLLLWDIDGTLANTGGAGERSLRTGLQEAFGISDSLEWLEWSGRTDRWIARQVLTYHGLAADEVAIQHYLQAYLKALKLEVDNPQSRLLSGVREIVDAVSKHPNLAQGLLTGNLIAGAEIKLSLFDFWRFFAVGAFADDSEDRNELGPHALRRSRQHFGYEFRPAQVVIIGDTPHDIACGRVINAHTLAVATGRHKADELSAHRPSTTFESLADTAAVLAWIESLL